jgi:hypothetical protein
MKYAAEVSASVQRGRGEGVSKVCAVDMLG